MSDTHTDRAADRKRRGISQPAQPVDAVQPEPMAHALVPVQVPIFTDCTTCPRSGTRSLSDGLLVAQGAIDGVGKDARNTFHKYAYTSAEGMISACRAALQVGGITARRVSWEIRGTDSQQFVVSALEIAHGYTGESARSEIAWPIIPDKGRPFDKAVAGALTTSLGYWLRDLLCLPREDEDGHMDGRDDRGHDPRPPARTRTDNASTLNQRLAAEKPARTLAAASERATLPRQVEPHEMAQRVTAAGNSPSDGAIEPRTAILHSVTEREASGKHFVIAELLADGVATQVVVVDELAATVQALIGKRIAPVVVDRGNRMGMLTELRVAQDGGGDVF